MCVFSKEFLIPKPEKPDQKKRSFFEFVRQEINRKNQTRQTEDALKLSDQIKLTLLLTYGIVPLKFNLLRALGLSTTKTAGATTVGVGATAGLGVPAGATAAGFTANGIAAGSLAAGWQASIGSVAAGSSFATLQSVGATGGFALLGPVGLIVGAAGLTIAGGTFVGVGIGKHVKEINEFAKKTKLILPHV